MIIPLDAGKIFDKIQNQFMIKVLKRHEVQGTYITQHDKAHLQQATANINIDGEKNQSISTKIRNKKTMSNLSKAIHSI